MSDGASGQSVRVDALALSRRELLAVAGAIVGALGLPGVSLAAGPIDDNAFHDLSVALTGFAPADRSMVAAFREAFAGELDDLARLYEVVLAAPPEGWAKAIDDAGLTPLAEALITAWYTGTVGEAGKSRVVTYLDAFVWYAVAYTKPPSKCDTAFGAWELRPAGDY